MKTDPQRERRRTPRVALKRVITYEASVSPYHRDPLAGKQLRGSLMNISNGGLCFKTKHRLQRRMVLKVNLPVGELTPSAPTLAQILWVSKDLNQRDYWTGLRFIL